MYDQKSFANALETAGFRRDPGVWAQGALFYTTQRGGAGVVVSLYPWHFTASLTKPGRDGAKVVDHVSGTTPEAFLAKATEWSIN